MILLKICDYLFYNYFIEFIKTKMSNIQKLKLGFCDNFILILIFLNIFDFF